MKTLYQAANAVEALVLQGYPGPSILAPGGETPAHRVITRPAQLREETVEGGRVAQQIGIGVSLSADRTELPLLLTLVSHP